MTKINYHKFAKCILVGTIAICLLFYISQVNFTDILLRLFKSPMVFVKILLATSISYLVATIAWYYCFSLKTRRFLPHIFMLFLIRNIGEAVSILTPINVVGGEYSKILMLESFGIEKTECTKATVLARVLIIASFILLCTLSLSYILYQISTWLVIGLSFIITLLFFLLRNLYQTERPLSNSKLPNSRLHRLKSRTYQSIDDIVTGIRRSRSDIAKSFGLASLHWLIGALEFLIILHHLDISISYLQSIIIEFGVIIFKSAGAFVPGQIGVEEYGNKLMLQSLGITSLEIWISVSLLRRIRQIIWIAIGVIATPFTFKTSIWRFSL